MSEKQLNEATLEERIGSVLKIVFPSFQKLKVKHQESFSIKFGHHNVFVDTNSFSKHPARAIYDILLTTEDDKTNLILLELKKGGYTITYDDIEQGLSYARLIHPMPPITLISNGVDNILFNTYSKTKIEKDSVDIEFLQKSIDGAFSLAINDFKQSLDILLNKNPQILSKIINDISASRFDKLKGELSDFTKPICENFIIERDCITELNDKCGERNLIGIIGHAFSGKTNILYDFYRHCNLKDNAIYYLDCKESNYSIFQQLSNYLTREFKFLVNKEKVREWIVSSLNNIENVSFTFLFDNFGIYTSHKLKEEIVELIDLLQGSIHKIIFTMDLLNYKSIANDKYRNYLTYFGEDTYIIEINELNFSEFESSCSKLYNVSKAFFERGAYFSIEYRQPRIQRLLASFFVNKSKNVPEGHVFRIIAVPDYELLKLFAENNSFNTELKELYVKLTFAFINDRFSNPNNDYFLNLASFYGGISLSSIKRIFKDNYQDLIDSGFVNMYKLKNGLSIVYPKMPELITLSGIEYITHIILEDFENKTVENIYSNFEKLCSPFMNSDIVGTGVLLKIAEKGYVDLFSNLVLHQLSLKPKKGKIIDGTKAAMLLDGKTQVDIEFKGDGLEESFISNFFPHLVLSQLAGYPLKLESSDKDNEYDFHLRLILDLAKSPFLMVRISNFTFNNIPPVETIEIEGVGTLICDSNGIIEPLVQSIQRCFYLMPEQIERLYELAFDKKIILVIWRIYMAINNEVNSVDNNISSRAKRFIDKFKKEFPDMISEIQYETLKSTEE